MKRKPEELWAGTNRFVEKYEGLTELDKPTAELSADLLHSVLVWPDGRVEVKLNYLDEIPYAVKKELYFGDNAEPGGLGSVDGHGHHPEAAGTEFNDFLQRF